LGRCGHSYRRPGFFTASELVTDPEEPKALFTSGVVGFVLPAHVLLIQDDVFAGNPQHEPVPQHDQNLIVVGLLDHGDSAT
jgi:hypothetical protein